MSTPQTQYRASFNDRLQATIGAVAHLPAFAARLEAAELQPEQLASPQDLVSLPIQTKDEVMEAQLARPPFGGMLAGDAEVTRVFQSPGPLYEPQLAGADPWRWAEALRAAGFRAADTVLNCFAYHLSPAGVMFDEAARALGARVFPGGIGASDLQARAISDLSMTAYTGLPSYLKALTERFNELDLDPRSWQLERAVVTAEPLPDSLRAELNEWVPTVLMAYGTAETGLLGYEDSPGGGLVVPDDVLIQVCDLDTGEPLTEGEGQIVVTLLRTEYPLIRFGTGDLSAWVRGPDDRPRLAGVLGRIGQAVKVRGMFLHPAQARRVIDAVEGVDAFRMVVDRDGHVDSLRCEIVTTGGNPEGIIAQVGERIRQELRFTCNVERVASIPEDAETLTDLRDWS